LQELCKEAAFEPVRELSSEQILKLDKFRDINIKDLNKALGKIRGTLSNKVVKEIENWNNQFGGGS
jgi:SpoVK/Ycf46/Vps4 family AAA+-type ATPase